MQIFRRRYTVVLDWFDDPDRFTDEPLIMHVRAANKAQAAAKATDDAARFADPETFYTVVIFRGHHTE
ncbi:hypothetical protein [Streptomyces sp. BH105]|uniref:hypothetical protein n=1 Tax=Streptomyces sp. BH105 TaxID=3410408 RepID=UPI003CE8E0F7